MIVTLKDLRRAKMCGKGARAFFSRHGLDWSDFVKQGIEAEKLENTKDAMAQRLVEVARGQR